MMALVQGHCLERRSPALARAHLVSIEHAWLQRTSTCWFAAETLAMRALGLTDRGGLPASGSKSLITLTSAVGARHFQSALVLGVGGTVTDCPHHDCSSDKRSE